MNPLFEVISSKRSKATEETDQTARVEPMRPERRGEQRRNPSTDQRRARRQMQRKTAGEGYRAWGADVEGLHPLASRHTSIPDDEMVFVAVGEEPPSQGLPPGWAGSTTPGAVICPYCDFVGSPEDVQAHIEQTPGHADQGTVSDQINARIPGAYDGVEATLRTVAAILRTAGNPHPVGSPGWFRWNAGEGDPASYGPTSGVPRDIFPEGGVPLRGELTPEQERWLHPRRAPEPRNLEDDLARTEHQASHDGFVTLAVQKQAEMVNDADHAVLDAAWHKAFDALKAAGLEADADHPIAAAYRAASNAVNHANRSRDFNIATGQPTASRTKTAARSCDSCGSDEHVTADRTLGKDLCAGCKRVLHSRRGRSSTESSLAVTAKQVEAFRVHHPFAPAPTGLCVTCNQHEGVHAPSRLAFFESALVSADRVPPGWPTISTTAVNESADGAARYQRTPDPAKPSWINDEFTDPNTTPTGGGASDPGEGYDSWADRGDALKEMDERRQMSVEENEGWLSPGWDSKVEPLTAARSGPGPTGDHDRCQRCYGKGWIDLGQDFDHTPADNTCPECQGTGIRKGASMHTEADLLSVMADTKRPMAERQQAAAQVEALRMQRAASVRADRESDLAASIIEAHLTPMLGGQSLHSTATDWVGDMETDTLTPDAEHEMRAEGSAWYARLHEAVKEDTEEFREQAIGMARRLAGRYGEDAEAAAQTFLHHVAGLHRREAAPYGNTNPQGSTFPVDPDWKDNKFLMDTNSEVPAEAKDPQAPGATEEKGAHAEHPNEPAFKETGWTGSLVAYVPAFQQVEARTGQQIPRQARPFIAALGAITSQRSIVGGVTASDVVKHAVALTDGWGGEMGTRLRTTLAEHFKRLSSTTCQTCGEGLWQGDDGQWYHKYDESPNEPEPHQAVPVQGQQGGAGLDGDHSDHGHDSDGRCVDLGPNGNIVTRFPPQTAAKTAGDAPPWLNGGGDGDDDKDDSKDDDSKSDKDDDDSKDDDDKDDKDSKSDDDKKDDDSDDDDDDSDDDKTASLLGSPVTAAFRTRVQAALARG